MAIRTVGVIGAGQMGSGIAQVCAVAGFDVKLNDLSAEKVDTALAAIERRRRRAGRGARPYREEQRTRRACRVRPHHRDRG
jgi:3-hydroxybutyryl-CoA dehydrogenase